VPVSTTTQKVTQEFTKSGDLARLKLQSSGTQVFSYPSSQQNQSEWLLELTPDVPVNLEISLGVGDGTVDLRGLQVPTVDYKTGVGTTSITLPDKGVSNVKIEVAIGSITIWVPAGTAVQLNSDTALATRSLPAGYVKQDSDTYVSPNFDTAENRVTLDVSVAIGQVTIKSK